MSTHTDWYDDLTSHTPRKAAAERAGIPTSTLNLQYSKGTLRPETVIALARAYGQNPVAALIATGYLDAEESGASISPEHALQIAPDQAFLDEIARRIHANRDRWDMPFDEAMGGGSNSNVTPIRPVVDDDDPLAGIDPTKYAAHPRTENLEEDNPTP
ncbi:hypothetical protein [Corynebacterium freneyi]|uniref:Immunity repressor n=1 Tax=Corynebacterium freneyi TaxID=134034 RepID=A0ABS4UA05_9CORY|nr:hypothetical protein [Corynebacterium freneyi]MBP2333348.1 hypothetical protein [Corynebacterium freneyi]QXA52601.1 hypothetical protein I6L56_11245 [Corynebacterium freneyi]WJZ04548.1 hypothetical protein CFREN_02810 [Corynebacterium freneyi]